MKRICKYLSTVCALIVLYACQKTTFMTPSPAPTTDEECVYMGMTLAFSGNSGTRSDETSDSEMPGGEMPDGGEPQEDPDNPSDGEPQEDPDNPEFGTEPGKESETAISEILLVLADAENRNVAAGLLENAAPVTGTTGNYVIAVPFRYVKELTGQTLNVYVFCNPTEELKSLAKNTPQGTLPTDFVDKIYTLSDFESDAAWQPGHFPMSNARAYTTTLPDSWNGYRAIASPFPLLGDEELEVERSIARFDYKTVKPENRYPVSADPAQIDETENPGVEIQLTQAAFVNVSKSFYYLRRVGDEGLANIRLCGVETKDNYVIDTDAAYKLEITNGWFAKAEYFYSNLEEPSTWVWDSLAALTETEEDNPWGGDTEPTQGFHIWRYLPENTAPSRESQVNAISTGIVFKGRIVPGTDCDPQLAAVLEAGEEPVYVYKNKLYGTWSMAEAAGETNEELRVAWNAVEKNEESLTEAGFTEYKPVNGIYENYYFYWNIHNDNKVDDPEAPDYLGPMKFAVVRNNVYKLKVDAIFNFGLTDPTPPGENGKNLYMMVTVKVLPWIEQKYEITIEE